MLNYIKAELYKAVRRRRLWILVGSLAALETLFAWMFLDTAEYYSLVELLFAGSAVGGFLTIFLADVVVSEPLKTGAVKNEVAFGLSRERIYLGKLASAALVAGAVCVGAYLWYLVGGWFFTGHSMPQRIAQELEELAQVTVSSLPLWLGSLGVAVAVMMNVRSIGGAVVCFSGLGVGTLALELMSDMRLEAVSRAASFLMGFVPWFQFVRLDGAVTPALAAQMWLLGLAWLAAGTGAGMAAFCRRELGGTG